MARWKVRRRSAGLTDEVDECGRRRDWRSRVQQGEPEAWAGLASHALERLRRLARRMLRQHPAVRRWEQTDDVLQNALLRLQRALQNVRPTTAREFFGLAAVQIRYALLDLA